MERVTYSIIAVGLAMDAFAVSLGIGTTGRAKDGRVVIPSFVSLWLFPGLYDPVGLVAGQQRGQLDRQFRSLGGVCPAGLGGRAHDQGWLCPRFGKRMEVLGGLLLVSHLVV